MKWISVRLSRCLDEPKKVKKRVKNTQKSLIIPAFFRYTQCIDFPWFKIKRIPFERRRWRLFRVQGGFEPETSQNRMEASSKEKSKGKSNCKFIPTIICWVRAVIKKSLIRTDLRFSSCEYANFSTHPKIQMGYSLLFFSVVILRC